MQVVAHNILSTFTNNQLTKTVTYEMTKDENDEWVKVDGTEKVKTTSVLKEPSEPTENNDAIITGYFNGNESNMNAWFIPSITLQNEEGTSGDFADMIDTVRFEPSEDVLDTLLKSTSLSLNTEGFTQTTWDEDWDENENEALSSRFNSHIWSENLHGNWDFLNIRHSNNGNDITTIPRISLDTDSLMIKDINCKTVEGALDTIRKVSAAQGALSSRRSLYGAIQNRLEHVYNNRANTMENTQAAESRIRDTDIAKEMVNYAAHGVIEQAGQSMLVQANQSTQGVMTLLQ